MLTIIGYVKKPWLAASLTTLILFVLFLLLLPVDYAYKVPWSCPDPPGSKKGDVIQGCPPAQYDKNRALYTLVNNHGSWVTGFHKGGGIPQLLDTRSVIVRDGSLAIFAGLLAYEIVDLRGRKSQKKRS